MLLGSALLASAAALGALRFSDVLPLPSLHQYLSLLGGSAGLPLLATAVAAPQSMVARQTRYAWILAGTACVLATVLVLVLPFKLWASVTALASALALLVAGLKHRQALPTAAGLSMLAALLLFAAKVSIPPLAPGDALHIGLAASLLLIGRHLRQQTH